VTAALTGRIGSGEQKAAAQLERDLDTAHRLIHALLRRHGGEAEITPGELNHQPAPWLTVQARNDGGVLVRAR